MGTNVGHTLVVYLKKAFITKEFAKINWRQNTRRRRGEEEEEKKHFITVFLVVLEPVCVEVVTISGTIKHSF